MPENKVIETAAETINDTVEIADTVTSVAEPIAKARKFPVREIGFTLLGSLLTLGVEVGIMLVKKKIAKEESRVQ